MSESSPICWRCNQTLTERDALAAKVKELEIQTEMHHQLAVTAYDQRDKAYAEIKELEAERDRLSEYLQHTDECILSFQEAGEPTPDGGYRIKIDGEWYQSRPVNELPPCDCGLDAALSAEAKE
jgi:hypothetical protein